METGKSDVTPSASQPYKIERRTTAKDIQDYMGAALIGEKQEPPVYEKANDILKRLNKSSLLELCEEYCLGEFHLIEECKDEHCHIAKEVYRLLTDLCKKCSEIDPRFESSPLWTGSSAEGTKMWLPDEFDFLLELVQLRGNCELYDQTLAFSSNLSLKKECQELWSNLCSNNTHSLCPLKLKDHFATLIRKAASVLDRNRYQNIRWLENDIEKTKVGVNITVHWCGDKYKEMPINIDLTPGISVHLSEDQLSSCETHSVRKLVNNCIHVIPHSKFGGIWRPSFSLSEFQMIKSLTRKQIALYKCLKFFRDMHVCTLFERRVPSYYLKTFLFNYLFRDNDGPCADAEGADFYRSFCRFLHHLILGTFSCPVGKDVIPHFFVDCNLVLTSSEMLWTKSTLRLLENC